MGAAHGERLFRNCPLSDHPRPPGGAAADFYTRAFGAEEVRRMPAEDGERLLHCQLKINGEDLFLSDDFPEWSGKEADKPAGVTIHLAVDDADAWWARALDAGCEVKMELADQFWGDRYGQLRDPFGHAWSVASPSSKAPADD
jgi:PhnB protein